MPPSLAVPILLYIPEHYRERERGWSRVLLEVFSFGAVCVKVGYMEKVGKVILRNLLENATILLDMFLVGVRAVVEVELNVFIF